MGRGDGVTPLSASRLDVQEEEKGCREAERVHLQSLGGRALEDLETDRAFNIPEEGWEQVRLVGNEEGEEPG